MKGRIVSILLTMLALCSTSSVSAQESPKITPGYATEGRPGFVDTYDSESLPWQRLTIPGMPAGMQARILSRDDRRGAVSLLSLAHYCTHARQQVFSGWSNQIRRQYSLLYPRAVRN